jgi:lysophospholipase L1-like esterase
MTKRTARWLAALGGGAWRAACLTADLFRHQVIGRTTPSLGLGVALIACWVGLLSCVPEDRGPGNQAPAAELQQRWLIGVNGLHRLHARDLHTPVAAVSWAENRLDVFARDARGNVAVKSWLPGWVPASGLTTIGGPAVGGEAVMGSPKAISWGPNSLHLFALGRSGNLLLKARSGSAWVPSAASDWASLGAPAAGIAAEPALASWGVDRLHVLVTGEDGNLYLKAWSPGWSGWVSLGGGSFVGTPEAVSWGTDVLHLFARKQDGTLAFKAWDRDRWVPSLSGWESLGAPANARIAGAPRVVSWGPDRLDLFVPATDGRLYMKSWVGNRWEPSGWALIGDAAIEGRTLVGGAEVVSWAPNRLHLVARAADGTLLIKAWAGDRWVPEGAASWVSLGMPAGGPITDPPAVVSWAADRLDIVARAGDGNLYMKSWVTDRWIPAAGWNLLAGPVAADPVEMMPLWTGDTVNDESVLLVRASASASATGRLLFPASRIISVRSAHRGIEYVEGVDWSHDGSSNQLVIPGGSRTPFITGAQVPWDRSGLQESHFLHDRQVSVSYQRAFPSNWSGPTPTFGTVLPGARKKLKPGGRLAIALYGDSITAGYNASGCGGRCSRHFADTAPFNASWGELVRRRLADDTGATVALDNDHAVVGWTSDPGLKDGALDRLLDGAPDLVVLAFGMNDGNPPAVPATVFADNVRKMMVKIRGRLPAAEIILVAPLQANPATYLWSPIRQDYEGELARLVDGPATALVRMSSVHQALLAPDRKSYLDGTGNGFNHPNDYLIRWQAQQIAGLLLP